jgi:hypothetical protein
MLSGKMYAAKTDGTRSEGGCTSSSLTPRSGSNSNLPTRIWGTLHPINIARGPLAFLSSHTSRLPAWNFFFFFFFFLSLAHIIYLNYFQQVFSISMMREVSRVAQVVKYVYDE